MVRISLDVTQGTFDQIREACRFQSKSDYLRELIDSDLVRKETANK